MLASFLIFTFIAILAASGPSPLPDSNLITFSADLVKGAIGNQTLTEHYQVFDLSFSDESTYYDPSTSTTYQLPVGSSCIFVDEQQYDSAFAFYESLSAYESSSVHGFHAGVSLSLPCGSTTKCYSLQAGYSRETGKIKESLEGNVSVLAYAYFQWQGHNLTWSSPSFMRPLYSGFTESIAYLPAELQTADDLAKYVQVAGLFGTSVVDEVTLGGFDHVTQTLNKSYVETKEISWVQQQASLTFGYLTFSLGISGFSNRSSINISADWRAHARNESFFRGGNASEFHEDGLDLDKWEKSIKTELSYVTAGVSPLTLAFPADAGAKAANYQKVVNYYVSKGKWPTSPPALEAYRPSRKDFPRHADELQRLMPGYSDWIDEHPREVEEHLAKSRAHFDSLPAEHMQALFHDIV